MLETVSSRVQVLDPVESPAEEAWGSRNAGVYS